MFIQTVKVGEISYMIDWHRMPGKKSLAIPLMMSMSNSTTKITAGNLIELSISSFGDVSIPHDTRANVHERISAAHYPHLPIKFCYQRFPLNKVIKTSVAYLNMLRTFTT